MGTVKGIVLGAVNVFVIAVVLGVTEHDSDLPGAVVIFGSIPGVVVGGALGLVAGISASRDPRWRVVILTLPAFGLVVMLAATFGLSAAVPVACVPTFIAALVLERWTREVAPPPPVPVATVRSPGAGSTS